jgi:uncharacterized protein DUF4232
VIRLRSSVLAAVVAVAVVPGATACASRAGPAARSPAAPAASAPAAAPSPGAPSPSSGTTVAPGPQCPTARLRITFTRTTGAVTGEVGGYLRFANTGATPCQLRGWPAVVAITTTGRSVKVRRAVHGTMLGAWRYVRPLPVLRLGPGAAAYAVIAAQDVPVGTARRCRVVRWLRVTPPGGSGYVTLSAHLFGRAYLPDCAAANGATGIQVTAIVPLHDLAH